MKMQVKVRNELGTVERHLQRALDFIQHDGVVGIAHECNTGVTIQLEMLSA